MKHKKGVMIRVQVRMQAMIGVSHRALAVCTALVSASLCGWRHNDHKMYCLYCTYENKTRRAQFQDDAGAIWVWSRPELFPRPSNAWLACGMSLAQHGRMLDWAPLLCVWHSYCQHTELHVSSSSYLVAVFVNRFLCIKKKQTKRIKYDQISTIVIFPKEKKENDL